MSILGILASPRIGGNTDILLDKVLEGASESGAKTKKLILNKLSYAACQECENVKDDGSCMVNDDMQTVYKEIKAADTIILASPIFFGSLTAQAKAMIDRFQCAWRAKYLLKKDIYNEKKTGVFISVEGTDRKDFFDNAKSIVKNMFATIGAEYKEELFCSQVDKKASILEHPDFLDEAFELGKKIA